MSAVALTPVVLIGALLLFAWAAALLHKRLPKDSTSFPAKITGS